MRETKGQHMWRRSKQTSLLASVVVALSACKPQSKTQTQAEEQASSLAAVSQRVDEGLGELMAEAETESEEVALGLTNSSRAGQRPAANPFGSVLKNVQSRWQSIQKNPCTIWSPLIRSSNGGLMHPYFFIGASAEAGVGIHGMVGRDFVWDFYNLQFSSFTYRAIEAVLGSGTAGAGVNTYLGLGFGLRNDVHEAWSGRFASTGVSGSLPVLSDYLSVHANMFHAVNSKGKMDPSFTGGTIGLSLALSVPTAIPGAVQISNGYWVADQNTNNMIAQKLSRMKIPHAVSGNGTCNGKCIRIDNGAKGRGYTARAVNLIRTFPAVLSGGQGQVYNTKMEKIILLALAVGAYRDTLNAAYLCRK